MKVLSSLILILIIVSSAPSKIALGNSSPSATATPSLFGFRDSTPESEIESRFLAVPDPKLAEQHLRRLTKDPHMAGTSEDKATADYVAQKFREAGLDTEIVEYKVWLNYPAEISVVATAPNGVIMHGP